METTLKVIRGIVILPNLPFKLCLSLYVLYKVLTNTSESELEMLDDGGFTSPELEKYINEVYPETLKYAVSIVTYGMLYLYTIN